MHAISKLLEWLLELISVALLFALTAIVVAAVIFRTLGASLPWYDELASVGLAWLTYYGAALAALKRSHMGFSGLLYSLPLGPRTALFVVAEIIVLGFFTTIAWYGYVVLEVLAWDSLISLPSVSLSVTQSVIPIGAALFIVAELLSMPEAWREMRAGIDPEHKAIEEAIATAEADLVKADLKESRG